MHSARLIKLFKTMSELTAPECAKTCNVPHSCCSSEYCDMAQDFINREGADVQIQDHPILKYMGPNGCVVPPHLRPLCTLHTCEINSIGFKAGDEEFTEEYFRVRGLIEEELSNDFQTTS